MRYLFLLLAAFCLSSCNSETEQSNADESTSGLSSAVPKFASQLVDPPWQDFEQPVLTGQIDAALGGQLSFPSGTEITIPPRAFVNSDGQEVTGQVTISLREYRTAAEIIGSGIPMKDWDDETQSYQNFSTAGMFDVRGTDKAQQAVEIAPGQTLEVHFASEVDGNYDFWYFDDEKGDWEQKGENTAEPFASPQSQRTTTANQPPRPSAPRKYDPEAIRMMFAGMNLADFPELNDPEKVALQYAGKPGTEDDPKENNWIFTTDWYKAELTKSAQAGVYQLYLENDDQEFTTRVQATLLPEAYDVALTTYRQKLAAYETAIQNMQQSRQRLASFRRSMQINNFGIYNYDVYGQWEEPIFANASFQPAAEKPWTNLEEVYLITDDGRITVRYPKGDWQRFNFDRNRNNLLLGITADSEVVLLSPEDFTSQSVDLASSTRQQEWNCVLEEDAFSVDGPANLQRLIDQHFAS